MGYAEPGAVRRRELPHDRVVLIVNLGDPLAVAGRAHGSFVAPLDERWAETESAGVSRGVEVRLDPLAARRLLGAPLDGLTVDLDAVLGREAALLAERLDGLPGWGARFALLDAVLARRLRDAPAPPPDVVQAWRRLQETGGALRIGALAAELGCSRRHLANRFRDHVGPAPKAVARLVRFRRALALLQGGRTTVAAVAAECGFADQAHLTREFRALTGSTPFPFLQDGVARAA